jgi:type I restriction enzyme R subunit
VSKLSEAKQKHEYTGPWLAQELLQTVRGNVTIDWTVKETVRAKLRVLVRRILRKYGYPPDKQEKATETVLKQAELLRADWAA